MRVIFLVGTVVRIGGSAVPRVDQRQGADVVGVRVRHQHQVDAAAGDLVQPFQVGERVFAAAVHTDSRVDQDVAARDLKQ